MQKVIEDDWITYQVDEATKEMRVRCWKVFSIENELDLQHSK